MKFTPREELSNYAWNHQGSNWKRMEIDPAVIRKLSERSTWNGLWRVSLFISFVGITSTATLMIAKHNLWLAMIPLYGYWFFYGFWVAIGHELQHQTVFDKNTKWFSEPLFYLIQTFMWNSPTYARKSHQLHHRCTMVRGVDPETDWPEIFDTNYVRGSLIGIIRSILIVGAFHGLYRDISTQIRRAAGKKDRMMTDHCNEQEILTIRRESLGILFFHLAVVAIAIVFQRWELLLFITIAWQVGSPIENLWHNTEHVTRIYNVNDQRLCTRSVKVGPFVKLIYWGLDHHIDHHIYPQVPSRNLPALHKLIHDKLPEELGVIDCWREMFAIAKEKAANPRNEYVPYFPANTADTPQP